MDQGSEINAREGVGCNSQKRKFFTAKDVETRRKREERFGRRLLMVFDLVCANRR
jgi:hypothetical protein